MDNNFSTQVKEIISYSREEALRLGNDFIGAEHLMLGLIRDQENTAIKVLKQLNVNLAELRKEIELAVKDKSGKNVANINSLPLTKQAEKVIRVTVLEAKALKSPMVETEHLLLSILKNKENIATQILNQFDIDQIPKEIEESMTVDGASKIQVFRYLIFPLARPGIAAAGTYAFIYSWNEFIFSLTFTNGQGARTLPVGIQQFIAEDLIRWDLITASGVMAAIPILIGFMFAQRVLISGLTAGAVKG